MTSTAPYTDTGAALLRAICLSPEDDAPRLAYADWLLENGQPERAEFIRVQCELGSLGFAEPREDLIRRNDRIGESARRQRSLWAKPETSSWFGGTSYIALGRSIFESPSYKDKSSGLIRRGFIDEVRCTLAEFMKNAQAIALVHPVRKWVLTDRRPLPFKGRYLWHNRNHDMVFSEMEDQADHIPEAIFMQLRGFRRKLVRVTNMVRRYMTADKANAALSQACYCFARQQLTA